MLDWLENSRPDLCVEISKIASTTSEKYGKNAKKYINRLNKVITYAQNYPTRIRCPKLDVATLRIVGYSEAAFAYNDTISSQEGWIIILLEADGNAVTISWRSHKSRRVTRSVPFGEVIAFAEMFDEAFAL